MLVPMLLRCVSQQLQATVTTRLTSSCVSRKHGLSSWAGYTLIPQLPCDNDINNRSYRPFALSPLQSSLVSCSYHTVPLGTGTTGRSTPLKTASFNRIQHFSAFNCEMAAKLRLHYLNGRGKAELIRYILHFAKAEFEDFRIEMSDWPNHKQNYPNLQVPVLEIVKDGKSYQLAQSLAIARHLAKRHNLVGSNAFEEARCDETVDSLVEVHTFGAAFVKEEDPERKEKNFKIFKDAMPRLLGRLEKQLAQNGGEHIVGDTWTWADLQVAVIFDGILTRLGPEVLESAQQSFPGLVRLQKRVEALPDIAAYREKRPVTPF